MRNARLRVVALATLGIGAMCLACAVTADDRVKDKSPPPQSSPERNPDKATMLEGEIVGIEGKDQLIIKTSDGKEVTVFVDPKTRIELQNKEKQFTDRHLVALLSSKGFTIARRTVAKYREQLRIPAAQYRAALV